MSQTRKCYFYDPGDNTVCVYDRVAKQVLSREPMDQYNQAHEMAWLSFKYNILNRAGNGQDTLGAHDPGVDIPD